MTTRPALVCVTGSRALTGHADARAWLRAELDRLAPAVVVTGDARGPDAWALEWCADAANMNSMVYALDGMVHHQRHHALFAWKAAYRWADVPPSECRDPRPWPWLRNEAMLRAVAESTVDAEVTVVGLRCPDATTRGTEHTLGLARAAGLPIVERTFFLAPTMPGFP